MESNNLAAVPKDKIFPASRATIVMSPSGGRWYGHKKYGKIVDIENHAGSDGLGRGKEIMLSVPAILQGSIALRLIDCGVEVRRAYMIGAKVAYLGQGMPVTFGNDPEPKPDPKFFREAGKIFRDGFTWLIVSPWGDADNYLNCEIFSDAGLAGVDGSKALVSIPIPVDSDHQPNVFLNLTEVCSYIAKCLDLPFRETFMTGEG